MQQTANRGKSGIAQINLLLISSFDQSLDIYYNCITVVVVVVVVVVVSAAAALVVVPTVAIV
jgi:hypothetical protein